MDNESQLDWMHQSEKNYLNEFGQEPICEYQGCTENPDGTNDDGLTYCYTHLQAD
jgi:hypothetical protein